MSIKYASTPQLQYGPRQSASPWARFPQNARPISTAPEQTSSPVVVYENNGFAHLALHYNNAWRKISPFKDPRSGAVSYRMDGTTISNPVAWAPPAPRKK